MKILIADDHRFIVEDLIDELKALKPDAVCIGTSDSAQIVPLFEEHRFDVVFLDIEMPGTNGIQLARKLLDIHPMTNIIYITGYPEYALENYSTYSSDFLVKPITTKMLTDTLRNLRHPVSDVTEAIIATEFSGKAAIGKRIEKYREERGLTKQALADLMDVQLQTVYRWERGERVPDVATFMRLMHVLGLKSEELLNFGEESPPIVHNTQNN